MNAINWPILAFFAGSVWVQHWTRLPTASEWFLIAGLCLSSYLSRCRVICFLLLGIIWAGVYADWRLSDRLAGHLEGRDILVQGYIASLPKHSESRTAFDFIVTQAPAGVPGKIRLDWYHPQQRLAAGQGWEMTLRLKKPHGRLNPGGFDYETWLFANHIGASGYVRPAPVARPVTLPFTLRHGLASWRQNLADRFEMAQAQTKHLGIIKALTIGDQGAIDHRQWEIFRATGTVHLMVISGTHISLIAGLVFLLARRVWIRLGVLSVSPQSVAAGFSWLAAVIYAGLAGFTIPTQRAMLMLSIVLLAVVRQRHSSPLYVLHLALLGVLLLDPLASLSTGFWLSFAAVGLLLYISCGRLGESGFWFRALRLHTYMAIGLAPLLIAFFQQTSVVAPLANWISVPIIGLLVMPLALLTALFAMFAPGFAGILLWPADLALQSILWILEQMAAWPSATVVSSQPAWYALAFALLGILLLLAPKGMPGRYLIPFLLLPLLFGQNDKPASGEIRLTLLDVGQGLAVVVQTANHVLVYDTGPRYSEQSDMGEVVLLPFLRHRHIRHVDTLIISHAENDHSGGADSLMAGVPVAEIYSSAAEWGLGTKRHFCKAGQRWRWDEVDFEVLSPDQEYFESKNDNSCVLKVSGVAGSLLMAGDIEYKAERWLVKTYGRKLESSVLIAPHHGSNTSSGGYFLDAVSPKLALVSAGYRNRFGFPDRRVSSRYRTRHIPLLTTAEQGAITIKLVEEKIRIQSFRRQQMRYWMDAGNTEFSPINISR